MLTYIPAWYRPNPAAEKAALRRHILATAPTRPPMAKLCRCTDRIWFNPGPHHHITMQRTPDRSPRGLPTVLFRSVHQPGDLASICWFAELAETYNPTYPGAVLWDTHRQGYLVEGWLLEAVLETIPRTRRYLEWLG